MWLASNKLLSINWELVSDSFRAIFRSELNLLHPEASPSPPHRTAWSQGPGVAGQSLPKCVRHPDCSKTCAKPNWCSERGAHCKSTPRGSSGQQSPKPSGHLSPQVRRAKRKSRTDLAAASKLVRWKRFPPAKGVGWCTRHSSQEHRTDFATKRTHHCSSRTSSHFRTYKQWECGADGKPMRHAEKW